MKVLSNTLNGILKLEMERHEDVYKRQDVELMSEGDKADINRIESLNPYMIGFPLYDNSKEKVYRIIKSIKEKLPNTLISVGGYAATFQGSKILEELEDIDFLVKGEGELPYWEPVSYTHLDVYKRQLR